jgi:5'-nucleotidase
LLLRRTLTVALCVALAAAGCSDDDAEDGGAADETTTTAPAEPLTIVVTNDDGIGAPGLDVLVSALVELDDVDVHVVAPAGDMTGSSDKKTAGGATYADAATASGVEGTAVDGFPADTITVALDELGLEPDLVVSGINKGQNVGPLAYASGTVGAGREAVRRGIPAIAGSAALDGDGYELAAQLIVDQIEEHRDDYISGTAGTESVTNINVPDCTAGEPKDLVEVDLATAIPEGVSVFASDCSADSAQEPTDDVMAVAAGHPALSLVPPEAPAG